MIAVVDVKIQAENPNMPLFPWRAFVGSPSSIRVRNVPKRIGNWHITKTYVQVSYPDNSLKTIDCVLVGGVYVATVDGANVSGTVTNGYTIFADGIDENNNVVTGYVLGKGDIYILEADSTITSSNNKYSVKLLSSETDLELVGDAYVADDKLYIIDYDGVQKTIGEIPENLSVETLSANSISGTSLSADSINLDGKDLTTQIKNIQDTVNEKQDKIYLNGILKGNGFGRIEVANLTETHDVWTVTGFPSSYQYEYSVSETYMQNPEGEYVWYYSVNVNSCNNPDWSYTQDLSEEYLGFYSYTRLDEFSATLRDWSYSYPDPLATYDVTATVQRNVNVYGIATTDELYYSQNEIFNDPLINAVVLTNREANYLDATSITDYLNIRLPSITTGKATDIVLTVKTGETVPSVSIYPPNAKFITSDSDWKTLASNSYNVFSFTSSGISNTWIVGRITSAIS